MLKRIVCILLLVVGIAWGETGISQSSTPIPYPDFSAGDSDSRLGVAAVSVAGDDFSLVGAGLGFVYRNAQTDVVAFDITASALAAAGSYDSDSFMTGQVVMLGANAELILDKSDKQSTILFGGPIYSYFYLYTDDSVYFEMEADMFGVQTGLQYNVWAGDTIYAPFALVYTMSGGGTVWTTGADIGVDVEATGTAFGITMYKTNREKSYEFKFDTGETTTVSATMNWHF